MSTTSQYVEATQRKAKKSEIMSFRNHRPHLYKKIFTSIGEIDTYYKLQKRRYLNGIMRMQLPDISVELHHSTKGHPRHLEIAKNIEKSLKKNRFQSKNFKIPVSINAIFTTFLPLHMLAKKNSDHKLEWIKQFFDRIQLIFKEDIVQICYEFFVAIDEPIAPVSDFRSTLFYFTIDVGHNDEEKPFIKINLKAERAQLKEFTIANCNRKAFRVGYLKGSSRLEWPCITLNGKEYPVFIQSHAIEALEKRVDCFDFNISMYFIAKSIEKNDMVTFSGSNLLGYYWFDIKLGYFVCCFVSGCLLIKTFLFITMDGTPEGEKINEKFGLEKKGKRYLDIDKLSSFLHTDLESDARIKELFSELGIGQLFEIEKDDAVVEKKQRAEELKRILCLF
ncbi:MAG: hypothetical protein GX267_02395 [Fibrobacter sp.]|jgi:hypothetical protein|nr:hypothetical protein [Fibrobacter sp.]